MKRVIPAALAVILLTGCPPKQNPYSYGGTLMYEMFPFDGIRTWEFVNTDEELSYSMIATMREQDPEAKEPKDGVPRYTIDYAKHCRGADPDCYEGEIMRTITWSSDLTEGVRIHDYEDTNGLIEFGTAIQLAPSEMERDDVEETKTDGYTWTSTLIGAENCPVRMNVDWEDCMHLVLDDGDGDDTTNTGLVGDYWAIAGFNVVAILLTADITTGPEDEEWGQWELTDHECEPLEDCDGNW